MREVDRKIRASEILGSYEAQAQKLTAVGERMAEKWVTNQAEFLEAVASELREIVNTGNLPEPC